MKRISIASMLAAALFLQAGIGIAEDQAPAPKENQAKKQTYGSQLMTREERIEHRNKMRAAKTDEEREQIRKEHHEKMKERAKERGITLPDKPVERKPLMTREERIEHRNRMRAAKTDEEREQIRKEHHEKMKERAKERGITLPDKPPAQGGGMGPGGGMGGGMPPDGARNR